MGVSRERLERAMKAALDGPEVKKLDIDDHEFNVKPISVTSEGVEKRVKGQLSHHLRFRDDDQVHYDFALGLGTEVSIDDININIDESTLNGLLDDAWDLAVDIFEKWLEEELSDGDTGTAGQALRAQVASVEDSVYERSKALLDGTWEGSARFLILNIAARVALKETNVVVARRLRRQSPGPGRVPGRFPDRVVVRRRVRTRERVGTDGRRVTVRDHRT